MPSRRARWLPAVLFSAAGLASTVGEVKDARADSCTVPDLIETIPADMATGVPTNATLFARYDTNAEYAQEPVTLDQFHMGAPVASGQAVPATFDPTSGLLQVTPSMLLTPLDSYVVHWPALRGIDTATLGSGGELHFTAGTTADTMVPTFAGLSSVSWNVSRQTDSCTNDIDERYVFNLGLGAAADDGGRDSLTLLVFQTAGPEVDANAATPVLVQRIPPDGQGVTITTTVQVGHVCFAAIVRDLTMKVSTSGAPVCVDTVSPPFFYSCALSPGRPSTSDAAALIALALAAVGAGRRASRSTPPRRGRGGSVA